MTAKNRKRSTVPAGERQRQSPPASTPAEAPALVEIPAPAEIPVPAETPFHAALLECAEEKVQQPLSRRPISLPFRLGSGQPQQIGLSGLARIWSWMHRKYTLTATKRLRVAETVSLGENRFVALVSVEGREFLIGGGASGVSLLATLGTTAKSTRARKSAVAGDSV
jgi:hypothetical protein